MRLETAFARAAGIARPFPAHATCRLSRHSPSSPRTVSPITSAAMRALLDLLDFHLQPSMIFALIGVIILITVAIIAFWGFDE